jgi:flagellar biosynthesis protein FlhF
MILVGPTGVGKTTTIAKLAAVFGPGNKESRPLSVRMITIDNYRIGAKLQVETYGDIMKIPVSCVDNYEELRKTIALYSEGVDLILVDTIGKNPRDSVEIAEMKELLSACGSAAEVHLTVAATTKYSDMREIFQQFEPFNYRSVIITKLDETTRVGNVISVLADKGKSISYITNGQHVPDDMHKAAVIPFLINLEDFKINRDKIEKRFSGVE